MARVLIAVPTFENISPDTFKSLWDMDKGEHTCIFEFVRGYDCASARNNIFSRALDLGVDYVMMVDSDVTVPCNALKYLLEDDVDVVMGYYAHREKGTQSSTKTNCCKRGELDYSMQYDGSELHALAEDGKHLERIHGGGMGCILVKRSVIERIPYPWFDWVNYRDVNQSVLSEDLFFCEQCRKYKIRVYADTRVACGHLCRYIQTV